MADESHRYGAFRRILFCTDFSENADLAFEFALQEALHSPAPNIHLLHAIPEPEAQFWKTYIYEVEDIDEKAKNDIDKKIEQTYLSRVPEGVTFEVEMRIGRDYLAILEFADEIDADLIIMGRQGRTALRTVLFGSVTEKIVRRANCPVLVIPLSFEEKLGWTR
ncbi:MAG: universal stress protein [Lentisphaerae bacterium]|jgi:nucleotide-binding universal stress UspA family protein|nr:universal stress protein [Lentisphaerota bacterium]MBT4821247.1 universal stress protein [Lentisphaerota bacterium]MBT5611064.1 universal stress protein [Lentisphaerota bacterium]MBT7055319.1 universal stress protein [Lentisphaerota bacterium]MBT7840520.1 universal stress protein [Lentisphaerota bacterium]